MKLRYILAILVSVSIMGACSDQASSPPVANESQTTSVQSLKYNYITPDDVAKAIRDKEKLTVLDTLPKDKFDKEHIVGAVPSYSYPSKTDDERALLKEVVDKIAPDHKIVIVCARGKSGAINAIDYLREIGVDNDRLLILEGGAADWPADKLSDITVRK